MRILYLKRNINSSVIENVLIRYNFLFNFSILEKRNRETSRDNYPHKVIKKEKLI